MAECANRKDATQRLNFPAVKSFISCIERKLNTSNTNNEDFVWLQGYVDDINVTNDEITLNDGTGFINVTNIMANVTGGDWIKKGVYCMVIATIRQNSRKLHAIKLTDLSNLPLEKKVWPKSVVHQQNALKHITK